MSAEEVVWTWLCHEHQFKRTLASVEDTLALRGTAIPPGLDLVRIRSALEHSKIAPADYREAVLQTVRDWERRTWVEVTLTGQALGSVRAQLPGEDDLIASCAFVPGLSGTAADLLPGWLEYLRANLTNPRVDEEARGHDSIVGCLRGSQDIGKIVLKRTELPGSPLTVGDGRHRLFAALEFMSECPALDLVVFAER